MIGEAIDTALALGWALAGWILVIAAALTVVVLAGIAGTAWTVRGVWRALDAAVRAAQALRAHRAAEATPGPSQAPPRPAPSWARTDKEAA